MLTSRLSLLAYLTKMELVRKHAATTGGLAYTVIAPMTLITVMWIALDFGLGLRAIIGPDFGINLIVGMTVWLAFSEAIGDSTSSIIRNPHFVKKIVFPINLLPMVSVSTPFCVHLIVLALLSSGLFFAGHLVLNQVWLLPFGLILTVAFATGLAMFVAGLSVIVRDIQVITPIIISIWFWVTPIVWQVSKVPEKWHWGFIFNPLAISIEAYRSALFGTPYPFTLTIVIASCIFVATVIGSGFLLFSTIQASFAENL